MTSTQITFENLNNYFKGKLRKEEKIPGITDKEKAFLEEILSHSKYQPQDIVAIGFGFSDSPNLNTIALTARGNEEQHKYPTDNAYNKLKQQLQQPHEFYKLAENMPNAKKIIQKGDRTQKFKNLGGDDGLKRIMVLYIKEIKKTNYTNKSRRQHLIFFIPWVYSSQFINISQSIIKTNTKF